jgi:hypothetical protein
MIFHASIASSLSRASAHRLMLGSAFMKASCRSLATWKTFCGWPSGRSLIAQGGDVLRYVVLGFLKPQPALSHSHGCASLG